MDAKREIRSLRQSFRYAFAGFLSCINNERNMRIHLSVFILLAVFSHYYGLTKLEFTLFTIVCGLVMFAEMINTAIEAVVDLCSPSYHRLARIAKDVAAGAVLLSAMVAVIVGICLFGDFARLLMTFEALVAEPHRIVLFAVLLLLLVLFILNGTGIISKRNQKKR